MDPTSDDRWSYKRKEGKFGTLRPRGRPRDERGRDVPTSLGWNVLRDCWQRPERIPEVVGSHQKSGGSTLILEF